MELKQKASMLLKDFKGDKYVFGQDTLDAVGKFAVQYGKSVLVISNDTYRKTVTDKVIASIQKQGCKLAGDRVAQGARPNAPREDVYRIETFILHFRPDCVVVVGGGSSIDAAKAAVVLAALGEHDPEIERYFGTGLVTEALRRTGKELLPLIAVQTASSSAAHLTKYSNVTDTMAGQKKLIVDETIVPAGAVFDYTVTETMSAGLTVDGALDGLAHCLEVFYGIGADKFELSAEITRTAVELLLRYTKRAIDNPHDLEAREALGLATDLGGYAIMVGGTNGGHLTSFSLVDVASHGRACGIMNPYYTVFFAPAIEPQLRIVGEVFEKAGFISSTDLKKLKGRDLGIAVARGMVNFSRSIGAPTKLSELPGFTDEHIHRALTAAKNPQLEMKLKNMPVPLNASLIDEYMAPVLRAAETGDFDLIVNIS